MRPAYWLLDVTLDGRVYRWSTTRVEVAGVVYQAGLADLTAEVGADQVTVSIVDPSVDWPSLAAAADGGGAVLRRWRTDQHPTQALEITSGELRVGSWGSRDDAFAATILRLTGATLGTQMPDALARIGDDTFPTSGATVTEHIDRGLSYPVIIGCPGYRGEDQDPYPCVPAPLAQYAFGVDIPWVVVAEDGSRPITQVRCRNESTSVEADETVTETRDLLKRSIRMMTFTDDAGPAPYVEDDQRSLFLGFSVAGGGGPRLAYEALVYALHRWGSGSVDWSRMPEVEDVLSPFLVDTWINDPQPDPWSWASAVLLPFLPVAIRTSSRGRYLVETRYRSDPTRRVGSVSVDRGEATINGAITLSDTGPYNEFTANYQPDRGGDWFGRVLLTGREGVASARLGGSIAPSPAVSAARSSLCSRSEARYGARPAEPVDLDWCWDEGTALEVLSWMAERDALPARIATYDVTDGDQLREGDEVLLTDTARGLVEVAAIVTAPPLLGSTVTTIDFRIPA